MFLCKMLSDISEYIRNDDSEYYYNKKEQIDRAIGMLYEDSNKQWIILVKEQDSVNFLLTLLHEYVHYVTIKVYQKSVII